MTEHTIGQDPPSTLHKAAFVHCLSLIMDNYEADDKRYLSALRTLTLAAGGYNLYSAMHADCFAPCAPTDSCQQCWLADYCVHQVAPPMLRRLAYALYTTLVKHQGNLTEELWTGVTESNKLDPEDIIRISKKLEVALEANFIAEALVPQDGDKTEDIEWIYTVLQDATIGGKDESESTNIQPAADTEDSDSGSDPCESN